MVQADLAVVLIIEIKAIYAGNAGALVHAGLAVGEVGADIAAAIRLEVVADLALFALLEASFTCQTASDPLIAG